MIKELFLVKCTRVHGLAVHRKYQRNHRFTKNFTQHTSCFMGLIMDRESLLLPPNASLIVREVPWLIITYRAAENEMVRSGDRCEDWWPTLQRTQAPAIYCQVLNSMVFPPHFWLRWQHCER